ncbi:glycosyltransferase family 39 protein [Candidatus Saccharibacteria bacterium]|nr:glycosyltransferase family 39 protein [Candidatus Saccharibacteria bacterium]
MGIDVTSFYTYRWRYWIGYGFVGALLVGLLLFAGLYVPGGISSQEMESVIKSSTISLSNIDSLAMTNLPYHLLQKASITIFGVSDFSIKLPSLILAFFSAIGLIVLLRRWFRPNIAFLASVIAVTASQFLFIAQNGTPDILSVLWAVWLLLLGTLIAKRAQPRTLWKVLFFIVSALSLYTPLSIYALVALGLSAVLHPHLRYIIRQLSKRRLAGAFVLGIIIIIPLALGVAKSPELGLSVLGIPAEWPSVKANVLLLVQQYLGFSLPSSTRLMTPVFGLGVMLIVGFGMYKLIRTRQSAQSYIVIIWLLCLVPILITNPLHTSVTFLPIVLLLATGLSSLLGYWYRLFPRNPYARVAGLVPLVILVGALVFNGLERYMYGYHYAPKTVANFSQDLSLLPKNTRQLVVTAEQLPFYQIVKTYHKDLAIVTEPSGNEFVATLAAKKTYTTYRIDRIVTSTTYKHADRFYVYKKTVE